MKTDNERIKCMKSTFDEFITEDSKQKKLFDQEYDKFLLSEQKAEKELSIATKIKGLRESVKMSRKEFSKHTGIPVRTLEDWEAGRRTPPEYIPRLIEYQLKYEKLLAESKKGWESFVKAIDMFSPDFMEDGRS